MGDSEHIQRYEKYAASKLKSILMLHQIEYSELVERLNGNGGNETYKAVAAKINRGKFTFAFFVQCMEVLELREVGLEFPKK
jgi:signal recognition particle GTPase